MGSFVATLGETARIVSGDQPAHLGELVGLDFGRIEKVGDHRLEIAAEDQVFDAAERGATNRRFAS